ncbi:MAG: hypothetical protein K2H60_04340 [Muribaculaceae bacterium]|nr:hypothetical protein [Muribaculaceae bacterium]
MKPNSKLLALLAFIILLAGACSHKAQTEGEESYGVSDNDSLSILSNTEEIMESFQEERFDEALSKLYVFDSSDTTVSPIPDEIAAQLRNRSRIFPVKDFKVKEAVFKEPLYNVIVYDVIFGEPSPDNCEVPTTKMAFNVININGNFYVTIMDQPTLK